jgi:large conductance mechanosensitive channel
MLTGAAPEGTGLADARKVGSVFAYGNFLTVVVNFAIIAFALFLVVKFMNRLKRRQEAAVAAEPTAEPVAADVKLLTEIRDLLAARRQG